MCGVLYDTERLPELLLMISVLIQKILQSFINIFEGLFVLEKPIRTSLPTVCLLSLSILRDVDLVSKLTLISLGATIYRCFERYDESSVEVVGLLFL